MIYSLALLGWGSLSEVVGGSGVQMAPERKGVERNYIRYLQ